MSFNHVGRRYCTSQMFTRYKGAAILGITDKKCLENYKTHLSHSVYLPLSLSLSLSLSVSISLSQYLSRSLCISLSLYLSVSHFTPLSISLSLYSTLSSSLSLSLSPSLFFSLSLSLTKALLSVIVSDFQSIASVMGCKYNQGYRNCCF